MRDGFKPKQVAVIFLAAPERYIRSHAIPPPSIKRVDIVCFCALSYLSPTEQIVPVLGLPLRHGDILDGSQRPRATFNGFLRRSKTNFSTILRSATWRDFRTTIVCRLNATTSQHGQFWWPIHVSNRARDLVSKNYDDLVIQD